MSDCIPGTGVPKPRVKLIGRDGNAFAILGAVKKALRRANCPPDVIDKYLA